MKQVEDFIHDNFTGDKYFGTAEMVRVLSAEIVCEPKKALQDIQRLCQTPHEGGGKQIAAIFLTATATLLQLGESNG